MFRFPFSIDARKRRKTPEWPSTIPDVDGHPG